MSALQLCRWKFSHTKKLCSRLSWKSSPLYRKRPLCIFEPPPLRLQATYAVHLRLIGKLLVDFLLVIIELFRWRATAEALRANTDWRSPFLKGVGQSGPKFQVEGDVLHQLFFLSESYDDWFFIWYKNIGRIFFRFVTIHAFDRQVDGLLMARPRLHSCSAVKTRLKCNATASPKCEIPLGFFQQLKSGVTFYRLSYFFSRAAYRVWKKTVLPFISAFDYNEYSDCNFKKS